MLIPVGTSTFTHPKRASAAGKKFLKMWPLLLPLDMLWSLSPFLLLHHIDFGVALVLMGAAEANVGAD